MDSLYDNVKSYSEILIELGRQNPNIFAVNSDMGTPTGFAREFPNRFVEVGIAEQNLIGVAAGLAIRGKIPFVYAMAPFVTMRSYEQIRTDLAYGEKNVKIISTCTGLSGGPWGTTHHSIEDITLMRVIPGMTVILPADRLETERAIRAAAEHIGLVYIRLGTNEPVYEDDYTAEAGVGRLKRVGIQDTFCTTIGSYEELCEIYGLTTKSIVEGVKTFI